MRRKLLGGAATLIIGMTFVGVAAIAAPNPECQYPNRSTNPPGGCDNTDPCDPVDAINGGSGDCKISLPDPNRDFFDACGNRYNYKGELINQSPECPLRQSATIEPPASTAPDYTSNNFRGK